MALPRVVEAQGEQLLWLLWLLLPALLLVVGVRGWWHLPAVQQTAEIDTTRTLAGHLHHSCC